MEGKKRVVPREISSAVETEYEAVVTTNVEKSAEVEVADCEPVEAKDRIICNVNQECMFR